MWQPGYFGRRSDGSIKLIVFGNKEGSVGEHSPHLVWLIVEFLSSNSKWNNDV